MGKYFFIFEFIRKEDIDLIFRSGPYFMCLRDLSKEMDPRLRSFLGHPFYGPRLGHAPHDYPYYFLNSNKIIYSFPSFHINNIKIFTCIFKLKHNKNFHTWHATSKHM